MKEHETQSDFPHQPTDMVLAHCPQGEVQYLEAQGMLGKYYCHPSVGCSVQIAMQKINLYVPYWLCDWFSVELPWDCQMYLSKCGLLPLILACNCIGNLLQLLSSATLATSWASSTFQRRSVFWFMISKKFWWTGKCKLTFISILCHGQLVVCGRMASWGWLPWHLLNCLNTSSSSNHGSPVNHWGKRKVASERDCKSKWVCWRRFLCILSHYISTNAAILDSLKLLKQQSCWLNIK